MAARCDRCVSAAPPHPRGDRPSRFQRRSRTHNPSDRRPSRFRKQPKTQTARARRALTPNGPGARLFSALGGNAYFFTLTPADLGLEPAFSDPAGRYDHGVMNRISSAVAAAFNGPVFSAAEEGRGSAGRRGALHLHLIAHRDDGPPHIRRGSERCKAVSDPAGLYRYLHKPDPYTLEAEIDHTAARAVSPTGRPPRCRRHYLSAERLAWAAERAVSGEPNALYDLTFSPAPDPAPDRSPIIAPALPAMIPDHALERVVITPPTAPRISSEIAAAQLPPMVCDAAGSITDQLSRAVLEAVTPEASLEPIPYRPPDRSSIRSITALEAGCVSVTAHLAPGSIPDPAFTPPELSVYSCPITAKSAESTTPVRPVLDGVSSVCGLSWSYPLRRKNRLSGRKNPVTPSLTLKTRLKVCTLGVLRGRSRQRPGARGPPVCP